ncbi:MAG: Re/Si-specific NAD(P)(+) transhydrogenase subunit alpha [bacterium]
MILGIIKESDRDEKRVALVPEVIPQVTKAGFKVLLERGAGEEAGFADQSYSARGVDVVTREEVLQQSDIIASIRVLGRDPTRWKTESVLIKEGLIFIGLADPYNSEELLRELSLKKATLFALELLPRITRAQSMDVLSSMATVAGYKAVLLAAAELPRMFPMFITAAGTVNPAKVFVVGAGVAGLQAIATARRLGAVVSAYDVRPAVKQEVESLGARFIEMGLESQDAQTAGGYARAMDESFYQRQRELMSDAVSSANVVISTAAVPGKRAPILITREMVEKMEPGSVIVDLAAAMGGNCELTQPDHKVIHNGVTILGPTNLPATVPYHASYMFAKNISAFIRNLINKEGKLDLDQDDPIITETLVLRDGKMVHGALKEHWKWS